MILYVVVLASYYIDKYLIKKYMQIYGELKSRRLNKMCHHRLVIIYLLRVNVTNVG